MITRTLDDAGYAADGDIAGPIRRVFEALTTLDGLAGWWTPSVTGTPTAGGETTFGFGDERVVMSTAPTPRRGSGQRSPSP